jgi:predicted nuclease with TOPRIM domain
MSEDEEHPYKDSHQDWLLTCVKYSYGFGFVSEDEYDDFVDRFDAVETWSELMVIERDLLSNFRPTFVPGERLINEAAEEGFIDGQKKETLIDVLGSLHASMEPEDFAEERIDLDVVPVFIDENKGFVEDINQEDKSEYRLEAGIEESKREKESSEARNNLFEDIVSDFEKVQDEVNRLEESVSDKESEIQELNSKLEEKQERISDLEQQQESVDELQSQNEELQDENEELQSKNERLVDQREDLAGELESVRRENERLIAGVEELRDNIRVSGADDEAVESGDTEVVGPGQENVEDAAEDAGSDDEDGYEFPVIVREDEDEDSVEDGGQS